MEHTAAGRFSTRFENDARYQSIRLRRAALNFGRRVANSRPLAYLAFLAVYVAPVTIVARHKLLWDDEFFTLYLSTTKNWTGLVRALSTGADQHPPSWNPELPPPGQCFSRRRQHKGSRSAHCTCQVVLQWIKHTACKHVDTKFRTPNRNAYTFADGGITAQLSRACAGASTCTRQSGSATDGATDAPAFPTAAGIGNRRCRRPKPTGKPGQLRSR
jgi:hypothetical protein